MLLDCVFNKCYTESAAKAVLRGNAKNPLIEIGMEPAADEPGRMSGAGAAALGYRPARGT